MLFSIRCLLLIFLISTIFIEQISTKSVSTTIAKRQTNYNFGQDEINIQQHQQEQQQQQQQQPGYDDQNEQQKFDIVSVKDNVKGPVQQQQDEQKLDIPQSPVQQQQEPIKNGGQQQQYPNLDQQQQQQEPIKNGGQQQQQHPELPIKNGGQPKYIDDNEQNILPGGQEPQKGGQKPIDDNQQVLLPGGQTGDDELEHKPGEPFAFSYQVNDNNGSEYSRKEESNGEIVTGEYQVLLPDGRLQIVKYTADWKNGYVPTITYVPAKPGREDETDIQPGGQKMPACPPGTKAVSSASASTKGGMSTKGGTSGTKGGEGDIRCVGPDEGEEEILPGGFTPKPFVCPAGTTPSKKDPMKCLGPDETEEEILPGGFTPKPKQCEEGQQLIDGKCSLPAEPPGLYGAPSIPFQERVHPKFGYTNNNDSNKNSNSKRSPNSSNTINKYHLQPPPSAKNHGKRSSESSIPTPNWSAFGLSRNKDGTFVFSRPY